MNTLSTLATFGEFSYSDKENGALVVNCSFEKEFQVECIVQNLKGKVIKNQFFSVNEQTKLLTLNLNLTEGDHLHVWFYIADQAFVREIKFDTNKKDQKGNSLSRFFRFFT